MTMQEMRMQVAEYTAKCYVDHEKHGDLYAFPMEGYINGYKGLHIAFYNREAVVSALESGRIFNACTIQDNVIKLTKMSVIAMRQAFGAPLDTAPTTFIHYNDIPKDASDCAGPRARSWEKIVVKAASERFPLDFRWVGALRNVQIDGISCQGKLRLEVKGFKGKFCDFYE